MKADRVRYDPRTGDVTAEGGVEARIAGRRVRAERLRYRARSSRLEISNLTLEGGLGEPAGAEPLTALRELATARGNGRGGVGAAAPVEGAPPSARLGAPWLEAEEAEARDDFSRIRGRRGVRLGAGAITIHGTAFDLDPHERRLEVENPVVRLREPRCTIVANRLLATDPSGDAPEIVVTGGVVVRLALPLGPRAQEVRLEALAHRLVVRRDLRDGPNAVAFTLSGSPVRIKAPGGEVELSGTEISGRLRRRSIAIQGAVEGELVVVASAFAERGSVRRAWTITAARSISVLPPIAKPSWLAGPGARRPERIVIRDARLASGETVPRLELFRPTWRARAK